MKESKCAEMAKQSIMQWYGHVADDGHVIAPGWNASKDHSMHPTYVEARCTELLEKMVEECANMAELCHIREGRDNLREAIAKAIRSLLTGKVQ